MAFPLSLRQSDRLRTLLTGPFEDAGPWVGRDLRVQSDKIRLSGTGGNGMSGAVSAGPGAGGAVAPRPSYQWLFFDELAGTVPAGPQTFTFTSPPIPFVGAITEVDVTASDPGTLWLMRLSVEGYGPIFKTEQPTDVLGPGEGWFRPTPPGFWPETEGLVVPVNNPGSVITLEFQRLSDAAPNLTIRVLVVAHPAF